MQNRLIQNSATTLGVKLFQSGTTTPATGKTPTVQICKTGGVFGSPHLGTVTEKGLGWYEVALDATDTNTVGLFIISLQATGCDNGDQAYNVVPGVAYSGTYVETSNVGAVAGVQANPGYENVAQGVTMTSITLAAPSADPRTASDLNGYEVELGAATAGNGQRGILFGYNPNTQTGNIVQYDGTLGWSVLPTGTLGYVLRCRLGDGIVPCVVVGTPTATTVRLSGTAVGTTTGVHVGQSLKFLTGPLAGGRFPITAFDGPTTTCTISGAPAAPQVGDVCYPV